MLKMIYASDQNGVIGKNNSLPWSLPSDLKRFKNLTMGDFVVMGRKTYESLPERFRPLPGRTNIVISTTTIVRHPEVLTFASLKSFLAVAKMEDSPYKEQDLWIIGGAQLYESCIEHVDEVYHTRILGEYEGDTVFNIKDHLDKFTLSSQDHYRLTEDKGLEYFLDIYVAKR